MMERDDLIRLIADKAVAHLEYDDMNPGVGMGMNHGTAIERAESEVLAEASRWNSIEALRLDFEPIRPEVRYMVWALRARR